MSMVDFHTRQEAEIALDEAHILRKEFIEELAKLDNYIFFLKYYLTTGEALNPDVIELPGEKDEG